MAEEKAPAEAGGGAKKEDNNMAVLAHVLGIFVGFIGPLIIYLVKPEEGYVKTQAKEALNFQITIMFGWVISWVLMFVLIGGLLMAAVGIYSLIMSIIAAMAASRSEDYRYPFAIRLIK